MISIINKLNRYKMLVVVGILCSTMACASGSKAATRPIMIGDLVKVRISGTTMDKVSRNINLIKNDREKNIKIDSLETTPDGNIELGIRCYNVGETTIDIGDSVLSIDVVSSLDELDANRQTANDIYIHLSDDSDTKVSWGKLSRNSLIGIGLLVIGILASCYAFVTRTRYINYDKKFRYVLNHLPDIDWEYELSMVLREYIDYKYESTFVAGKYVKVGKIDDEDISFINELDNYKFAPLSLKYRNNETNGVQSDDIILKESISKAKSIYDKIKGDDDIHV